METLRRYTAYNLYNFFKFSGLDKKKRYWMLSLPPFITWYQVSFEFSKGRNKMFSSDLPPCFQPVFTQQTTIFICFYILVN